MFSQISKCTITVSLRKNKFISFKRKSSLCCTIKLKEAMSEVKSVSCDFHEGESINGEKLIYPAATRNKEPILQVLKRFMTCNEDKSEETLFMEIASGSGQHIAHFAPHFPSVKFQPTERDLSLMGSIRYYADNCPTNNVRHPLAVDIRNKISDYFDIKEESVDYLYNANMMHISPYECTIGLFINAGLFLKPNGLMITYGPFSKDGIITPDSNVQFDASLKARDSSWGIRDINDLLKLAKDHNLSLIETVEMPANNKTLIWRKHLTST